MVWGKDDEYQDEDGETVDEDFLNLACLKKRATLTDYKKACINSTGMIGAFKPNLIKHSQWSSTIITRCSNPVIKCHRMPSDGESRGRAVPASHVEVRDTGHSSHVAA